MSTLRRRTILAGALAPFATWAAPAVHAQSGGKPYNGTTINASCFQTTYYEYLKNYFPQFQEKTGIKVNFTMQAFPVYNQRTDLELPRPRASRRWMSATSPSSILAAWIGAGWNDAARPILQGHQVHAGRLGYRTTSSSGAQSAMKNAKGETFAFTHEAGAMLNIASRYDLIEKAGLKMPETFDDLIKVCDAVDGKDNVKAFVADKLHHWNWIPYLMGNGGSVRQATRRRTSRRPSPRPRASPRLDWYANLLDEVRAATASSPTPTTRRCARRCRAAPTCAPSAITWGVPLVKDAESKVSKTTRFALMPAGPKGNFPGSQQPRLGHSRPAPRRRKRPGNSSSGPFSKEMINMIVEKHGYPSVCCTSVIKSPTFKEVLTLNGQDVAALYLEVPSQLGGKTGYMKYRTVRCLPQVGDQIKPGDRQDRDQAAGRGRCDEAGAIRSCAGSAEGRHQG